MERIDYRVRPLSLTKNPAFLEASKEELRVLLALVELNGSADSIDSIAKMSGISVPRCKSSLAFWEESGVISRGCEPTITDEFEDRLYRGEIDETPAVQVAESIRDENLSSMLDECAALMGQACLAQVDVKNLTALYTQYGLSAEFIVTLAANIASRDTLTPRKLCNKAIRLSEGGCDSVELLEEYLTQSEKSSGYEYEYRRVLGIYGRNLSKSEKEYFKKWAEVFEYSSAIVSEAYDIAVMNTKSGRGDLRYMDTILSAWHEGGCKTLSECLAKAESDKQKKVEAKAKRTPSKTKPETPRYGDFDVNDAFMKALERSYGTDEN